jgi:outer membrane protein assembly factor BamB
MKLFTAPSRTTCLALGISLLSIPLRAADWPHWLGPDSDNITPAGDSFNPDLSKWNIAWKTNVGLGYSSVAVADGRAFTLGHDGKSHETVFCFDAASGRLLWNYAYEAQLMPVMHPGGPNATATVFGNRVFTVSTDGQAFCFSADHGEKIWRTDLVTVMGVKLPQWGFASSPVVVGNNILLSAGKVAALDLATGNLAWISKGDYPPAYTTTVPFQVDGASLIAALDANGLSILSARDGAEVAHHAFKTIYNVTATTPFVLDQGKKVFISGNASSEMLAFDGRSLTSLWTSTDIKNSMNNSVILDGAIYGIDGSQNNNSSRFVSINLADGKPNWSKDSFGYGNTIGVGNLILAMNESGELVTIKPSPQSYNEISRLQVLGKLCWTTPTFAGGRIYVRNDKGDVACLSLP